MKGFWFNFVLSIGFGIIGLYAVVQADALVRDGIDRHLHCTGVTCQNAGIPCNPTANACTKNPGAPAGSCFCANPPVMQRSVAVSLTRVWTDSGASSDTGSRMRIFFGLQHAILFFNFGIDDLLFALCR